MNLSACWSEICFVDTAPLAEWLALNPQQWPEVAETKPSRVFVLPDLFYPVINVILARFPDAVVPHQQMLSRMTPGQSHPMHVDSQRADWITRVHVPLVTNLGAWILFEDDGCEEDDCRVHFEAGRAYTFNTLRRHAFGNHGDTDRVHLIFDVLRRD